MAKILLVEDDNNLREIYEARLQAEGYTIVAAQDGEEALVKAKQEKPDLVISDVMMPRISGFEMLDILRNTEGLKNAKVIMLTALGQAEDKTRADALGADRYLVKSQVTLEDIVKAAGELLQPAGAATDSASTAAASPAPVTPPEPVVTPTPVLPAVEPSTVDVPPVATPVQAPISVSVPTPPTVPSTPTSAAPIVPTVTSMPVVSAPPVTAPTPVAPSAAAPSPAPAVPAQAPVAASTTTPEISPTSTPPAATSPTPASTAPSTTAQESNDALITNAVRNLTADINKPAEPEAPKQTVTPPVQTPALETPAPEVKTTEEPADDSKATEPVGGGTTPELAQPAAVANETGATPEVTPAPAAEPTPTETATRTPEVIPTAQAVGDTLVAQSSADEQAQMQSQIEDFIKQQGSSTAPEVEPPILPNAAQGTETESTTTQESGLAASVEPTVTIPELAIPTESNPTPSAPETTNPVPDVTPIIKPSGSATFAPKPDEDTDVSASQANNQDDVTIAHKKIIQPPVEPINTQPDLNELLAKEGISDMDDMHTDDQPSAPVDTHQPGHVISPDGNPDAAAAAPPSNAFNPNDPNNIAL